MPNLCLVCEGTTFSRAEIVASADPLCGRPARSEAERNKKPQWLKPASAPANGTAEAVPLRKQLYELHDLPFGPAESLHYIPLERVRLIRYVGPADADLRWGGSHATGAILVTTLK